MARVSTKPAEEQVLELIITLKAMADRLVRLHTNGFDYDEMVEAALLCDKSRAYLLQAVAKNVTWEAGEKQKAPKPPAGK